MFNVAKWTGGALSEGGGYAAPMARRQMRAKVSGLRPNSCFVVDDDQAVRRVIVNAVEGTGAVCAEVASAGELFKMLAAFVPSLIFLDISLEDSDAIEVIRGLATRKYGGAIQLISGRGERIVSSIHAVGVRHGLNMLPPLMKPCSIKIVREIATAQLKKVDKENIGAAGVVIDLDVALQKNWVEVWYQPKIDLQRKHLAGLEALARVKHPDYGIVLPSEFLVHATRSCLRRLTEHMILSAMQQWRPMKQIGFAPKVAINISVDCLVNVPIAKLIRDHRPTDVNWPGVIFELTEDQVIREIDAIQDVAAQLMIYDVAFSVDDFGAGYSSFQRLKQFAFTEFKLAGSFVQGCSTNEQNAAICRSIIDLAHSFGATVVAKCVETPEDLLELYKMNCDMGQGYLLSRPMPMNELVPFLTSKAYPQRKLAFGD